MRLSIAWVMAAVAVAAGAAAASEKSEALDARGAVDLHEGRLTEALSLFDQALVADPDDVVARFHRGVARTKNGDYDGAIADFEYALRVKPDFDEAALELGTALVESNRAGEARPWLEQAQRNPQLDGQASFFLGIANLREGRYEEAETCFERARAKDPDLEVSSRYYLGVVEYRLGNSAAARTHFEFVQERAPEAAIGREATAFLEVLRSNGGRGNRLYGSVSLQYDSNVVLAPANGLPAPAISDQADGRVTINAGGLYVPWQNDWLRLSLGYDFYQNLQFQLTDFDFQDHRPSVVLSADFGPFRGGILAQYDYDLLDNSSFLQELTAQPWLVFPEGDRGRTEVYMRYRFRDYLDSDFEILDGNNFAGGARQVFSLGEVGREAWVSFQSEGQDPSRNGGDLYGYDAIQAEVALSWTLPWEIESQVGYRFRREQYDQASAIFLPVGSARLDKEHRAGVAFRRPITDLIAVVASWIGTFNDSNKTDFEYNRQIGSIGVEVRY